MAACRVQKLKLAVVKIHAGSMVLRRRVAGLRKCLDTEDIPLRTRTKGAFELGIAQSLAGKQRAEPARPKFLTGDEVARIIATRRGKPLRSLRELVTAFAG